jgi:hypothetical protein
MAFRPYILVLAIVAIVVYSIAAPQPIKPFQDDGIISKIGSLKLRNGIGYHMKKNNKTSLTRIVHITKVRCQLFT